VFVWWGAANAVTLLGTCSSTASRAEEWFRGVASRWLLVAQLTRDERELSLQAEQAVEVLVHLIVRAMLAVYGHGAAVWERHCRCCQAAQEGQW
jgi:hypothetical protein